MIKPRVDFGKEIKHMKTWMIRLVAGVLVCGTLVLGVFAEHNGIKNTPEDEKIRVLKLLEIMNGDENGNLNLEAPVTRAEFVKMAVAASVYKDNAGKSSAVSLFPDVTSAHWAAGFISTAIGTGLVSGYLDGTFRPENPVKLEEAVIIVLKLLGYTTEDFKGTYPEAQLAKYQEIDLDTAMTANAGMTLTRRDCMLLLYNTLCTKTKSGAYYCTTLGVSSDSDNTVDYRALLNKDMAGAFVNINGNWEEKVSFSGYDNLTLYRDGKTVEKSAVCDNDVYYYSTKLATVWFYSDKESGILQAISPNRENPASVTVSGKTYTLSTVEAVDKCSNLGAFETDMFVTLLLGKDGSVVDILPAGNEIIGDGDQQISYAEVVQSTLKGPYIVASDGKLQSGNKINEENAVIYKNNKQGTAADIEKYNVYYLSELLNTVWLYDDTVSGTLESVSPSRMSPSQITVSGKTYALESEQAVFDFSSLGIYTVGDRVTLLLGKDGGVAGTAGIDELHKTVYGVVIANGEKQYTDADGKAYTADTVTVFAANGSTYTYEFDSYIQVGSAVRVITNDGNTKISKLTGPKSVSYAVELNQAVKDGKFASDAEIIEYFNSSVYGTVLPSRLTGKQIWYSDILYYEMNDNGEIEVLILDNYTGDLLEYGLLTEVDGSTYTYLLDGEETTYHSGDVRYTVVPGAAYFAISDGKISKIGNISGEVDIAVITGNKAYSDTDVVYEMDDHVRVYVRENGKYKVYDEQKLKEKNYSHITGYYDKDPEKGGKIRLITAY